MDHKHGGTLNVINFAHISFDFFCSEDSMVQLLMQACNAHGLYCVPFYDTLGTPFQDNQVFFFHSS